MQSYRAIFSRLFMLSCPDSINHKNLRAQPSGHTRKSILRLFADILLISAESGEQQLIIMQCCLIVDARLKVII